MTETTEEEDQVALVAMLVGRALKGQDRVIGAGLTGKHPELSLLYAIPNGARIGAGTGGRMKAMGQLRGVPDLCLPCIRGPFAGLYVEMKRAGKKSRPEQVAIQEALREECYCVVECAGVQAGAQVILGYLALPRNRLSARPISGELRELPTIDERLTRWRQQCAAMLQVEPHPEGYPESTDRDP